MSSSPIKKYNTSEIIKEQLDKLRLLKKRGLMKVHEEAQMKKLELDLIDVERLENK